MLLFKTSKAALVEVVVAVAAAVKVDVVVVVVVAAEINRGTFQRKKTRKRWRRKKKVWNRIIRFSEEEEKRWRKTFWCLEGFFRFGASCSSRTNIPGSSAWGPPSLFLFVISGAGVLLLLLYVLGLNFIAAQKKTQPNMTINARWVLWTDLHRRGLVSKPLKFELEMDAQICCRSWCWCC